jgi:ParB-like chromosome segregation protein Spo0J
MIARRDPVKHAAEMAATPFAQLAAQVKEQTMLPIAQIVRSPYQSRVDAQPQTVSPDAEDYIADLAATIERDGLLNPILVRQLPAGTEVTPDMTLPYYGSRVGDDDALPYYGSLDPAQPIYELVAGENRVLAHMFLRRGAVPGKVLRLGDVDAARALTIDNLVRKGMTDWELYLHLVMLRKVGAATSQRECAALLGCSRGKVAMLECYGRLPARVREMLATKPDLLGANQVQALASNKYLEEHPNAVVEAAEMVAAGKIGQSGMVGFIARRVRAEPPSDRRAYQLSIGKAKVRVVSKDGETRITGDVDGDALREVLQSHLERLIRRDE